MESVMVFDIGTTMVKGGVFSYDGKLLESASFRVEECAADDPLRHEVDPGVWLEAVKTIAGKLLHVISTGSLKAVVVSGNGPTLVACDRTGKSVCPAILWLDKRAVRQSGRMFDLTGEKADPSFYLPKVLWLKDNAREIYEKTCYFLAPAEYVNFILTGEASMVFPGEGLEKVLWTEELIKKLGLDADKFPPFTETGSFAGDTGKRAADILGIPEGISVFAGGVDFIMSILGSGAVVPGRSCDRTGTSEGINICSEKNIDDNRLMSYRHVVPGYWNVTGIISTTGRAVEWFRNGFSPSSGFEEIYRRAEKVKRGAGKLIFLPYLSGERSPLWDPDARGTFLGFSLAHGMDEMARAVIESSGFAIRHVLETAEENGVETEELRVAGRASGIDLLNRIKADITGKVVLVPEISSAELLGGLAVALTGLGVFDTLQNASSALVSIKKIFEPSPGRGIYDDLFSIYRQAYGKLKDLYSEMADI